MTRSKPFLEAMAIILPGDMVYIQEYNLETKTYATVPALVIEKYKESFKCCIQTSAKYLVIDRYNAYLWQNRPQRWKRKQQ